LRDDCVRQVSSRVVVDFVLVRCFSYLMGGCSLAKEQQMRYPELQKAQAAADVARELLKSMAAGSMTSATIKRA